MAHGLNSTAADVSERTPLLARQDSVAGREDSDRTEIEHDPNTDFGISDDSSVRSYTRSESNATTVAEDVESGIKDSSADASKTRSPTEVVPDDEEIKIPTKIVIILFIARIGSFLAALDMTILATLSGPISSSFNSLTLLPWIATGYTIANAACQPLSGKLTDIYGRKNGILFCNMVFGIGTLICGLAPTAEVIIVGRVIAGIGGGGQSTIATFLTADFVPMRSRAVWQSINSLTFLLGSSLGGLVGGWTTDYLSWRWAFLIQLPLVAISFVLVWYLMDVPSGPAESDKPALERIDFLGAGLLTMMLVLFLLGINTGGSQLPWSHPLIIAALVGSVCTAALFCYVETHPSIAPEPIIPLSVVFQSRTIASNLVANFAGAVSMMIILYYFPIFLEIRGDSATLVGYRMALTGLVVAIATVITAVGMKRTGRYKLLAYIAIVWMLPGTGLMLATRMDMPEWPTYLIMFPFNIGWGIAIPTLIIGLMAASDKEYHATLTAAQYAVRTTGYSVGIALGGAIIHNVLTVTLNQKYGKIPHGREIIKSIQDSLSWVHDPPAGIDKQVIIDAYMIGIKGSFAASLAVVVVAAVAVCLMKDHVLKKKL